MDWFHCNNCFLRRGNNFVVSSCGHVLCEGCTQPNHCCVCQSSCSYLPISDQMKPQEQMFFKNPINIIQTRLERIAQIAAFQRKQKERVIAFHKHKFVEMERRLKEVNEQYHRQVSELRKENAELRKPLSQRRVSPGTFKANGSIPRMTLPVAVTSPVTPLSRTVSHPGSGDTMERFRHFTPSMASLLDSATPVSSLSSLNEHGFRTPTPLTTPVRPDHVTPNIFQFQLLPGATFQSPQPWNV
ncbi:RING finger protein 212B isoform X2 [Ictalurus punctatus]|nr:RING finger protein 212B isoform X2 [Ictalurus punctatus]XP_047012557.1 RING finger protein 212B isoform X2 [Ictalurus punctatus]XP_047012558.1 RING finger protein 212B isoform X2 [Ictalurus punctatus]XP_047012559.1 RING finger protein 212B isoform X2 [Ictalurus punctatus]XP_047012560.1 RING finger protein 212B isoform X2 [Ictalurus punctatus]XP_047012561.1 RING finger protein 212B isoform X2 [Ictalurus punctatus]